jgi:hypothetical protein
MTVECFDAGEVLLGAFPRPASPRAEMEGPAFRREFICALRAWEQLTPSFATREYWEFLQTEKPRIDALYGKLQRLLEV